MVLQLAAMALLVLIINVFNMTNILMTCVFAMLAQWRVLCASVWLLVSDPPRDTTSTAIRAPGNARTRGAPKGRTEADTTAPTEAGISATPERASGPVEEETAAERAEARGDPKLSRRCGRNSALCGRNSALTPRLEPRGEGRINCRTVSAGERR